MPSDSWFNTVIILDSIPDGELNTARRLRDDLWDVAYECLPIPGVEYYRVGSVADLKSTIKEICIRTGTAGVWPLLHIEAHGWEDGITLATGKPVMWSEIKDLLIPLNKATGLNLMVVLASCYGGSFIKSFRLSDRAPVWGLIGPTRALSVAQIQKDFGTFYKTLFRTQSPRQALETLNSNAPTELYYRTTAEGFFYKVWKRYKDNLCTKQKLDIRARKMYRRAKAEGISPLPSVGQLRRSLVRQEPNSFNKFRDRYFMYDIFPKNALRFNVTYERAESRNGLI